MYYIAICDDDYSFVKYIEKKLLECGIKREEAIFYEYNSGESLISSLDTCEDIDLLVLDMQMEEMDGHETARHFRKWFPSSLIVFCSGVCMPTVESFETTPFRYLLKEYTDEKMVKELKVIIKELKSRQVEPVIMGIWNHSRIRLCLDEILFISIAKRGSNIYVIADKNQFGTDNCLMSKRKISELYLLLKNYGFEYAHNSYIVNLNHIVRMTRTELELCNGTKLSVSRSKEKELKVAFAKCKAHKY